MSGRFTSNVLVRYSALIAALLLMVMGIAIGWRTLWGGALFALGAGATALGVWDLRQRRHTLMRNYPVLAHLRWLSEYVRPFLRQYFVEDDLNGRPYNRAQRSLIYARATDAVDVHPFGSDLDMYAPNFEMLTHSVAARPVPDSDFRVSVGNDQCTLPYSASVFNISAMSFGALSARAIEALNRGARLGGFYHDTGEGGISDYHRHGGDLVWELGSGYFGCRNGRGEFDVERFAAQAAAEQVKMVEIKLSQGAKPGHGGVLPGAKVSAEIARTRHVTPGEDCVSPAFHSAFSTPLELVEFAALLRERAGGKPVGIKLCVGHPWEVLAICKAMLKSGIHLDFIVVDGAEGGTGAAPEEFSDHLGLPLREGLLVVRNALVGTRLRTQVRIGAGGKVVSAFSVASNLALGADWCNAARAFMFALGCVLSKRCHTDTCPTGVATQDRGRQRGLVIGQKAERVANLHRHTLHRLAELVAAAGLSHPGELAPHHLYHRLNPVTVETVDRIYPFLDEGVLLAAPQETPYAHWWSAADAESFQPRHTVGPTHHKDVVAS